ncbi:dehydrogenase/reductase SDR family member on chromosome X-like [Papaver somniferum]|uniref:dehydrogenase/reductase SDR family member on chromosome X-like n=1 Tax=Papaver somniferum TaxID=3469 RepID=UPI000E701FC3|nr:dehydrogenase/reductase SDR family member on chromosome X-like [Papaver somniferum]
MKKILIELRDSLYFLCSIQFWRMGVLWTSSIIYSYLQLWLNKVMFRKCKSYPRCSLKLSPSAAKRPVCVVTGATSGLGAAAALSLSKEGYYVVLAGRNAQNLSEAVKEIKQRQPDAHLKTFQVDLTSFESILKFKSSLQQWLLDSDMHTSIQLLVNNAGILATSRRFTAEGYDQMITTNYIAAFSVTNLLLPLLKNSCAPSRIVNVTSFTHRCVSGIDVCRKGLTGNDSLASKRYPCAQVYEYTKFCLLMFSYQLHRQFCLDGHSPQVSVIAADPGVVETNLMREVPSHLSFLAIRILKFLGLLQSPDNGVEAIIDASLAPPEVSGEYFFGGNGRVTNSSSLSYDTKLAERLWTTSSNLFLELQLSYKNPAEKA